MFEFVLPTDNTATPVMIPTLDEIVTIDIDDTTRWLKTQQVKKLSKLMASTINSPNSKYSKCWIRTL